MQEGDLVRIRQDDGASRRYWSYWVRQDPTLADATIIVIQANNADTSVFQRLDGKPWPDDRKTARLINYNLINI